ncbi:MAG TPA: helix-turn-helix domain-containing protein [Tepidisphaeraceae bacterium]|jgi:hypothetical protein|nr:helix-turn-helix domain-containing protein [Tepidisphaeraceae bacterium]
MAKMFYTMDEAKAALGKSEDEIKAYAREGRLREFRDGPRLMFKSDQIEALKNDVGGGDSGAPISLADSRSSSGAGIELEDPGISGSGLGSGLSSSGGGGGSGIGGLSGSGLGNITLKDDTALAADLGLSGTGLSGTAAGARAGTGMSGSMGGSRVGINVFGEDADHADPMAQTNVSPAMRDQLSLEAVGSGSGLLDLTRESDDTSLGADTLDEITPGTSRGNRSAAPMSDTVGSLAGGTGIGSGVPAIETSAPAVTRSPRGAVVREVERPDPMAPAFGGAALGAAFLGLFAAFAIFAGSMGAYPDLVQKAGEQTFFILTAILLGIALLFWVFGLFIGKALGGR